MNIKIKRFLKTIVAAMSPLKPFLEWFCEAESAIASAWVRSSHMRLMMVQWVFPPQPESFDHHIDLYYYWQKSRDPGWLERGVYGSLALKRGKVLELCCGDGFITRNFYSLISESIIACDFDLHILKTARRKNSASNIQFVQADIRTHMPKGNFDTIVWNSAIEHFTEAEIREIMKSIKTRLTPSGIFFGHTISEKSDGIKQLSHHEYEFKNKEDLLRFFTPHFQNVTVFETVYPERHNLYVWASDGSIPFTAGWQDACTYQENSY